MEALDNAKKMNREEIFQKVKSACLREFGVYNEGLVEKWHHALAENKEWNQPLKIIAALNNNDRNRALLSLLRNKTDEILAGIQIAAYTLGAKEMELYIPEEEEELKRFLTPTARDLGIALCDGMVDVRASRGSCIHHIETMEALGELFAGTYEPGTWITVCQSGNCEELKKISFGKSVQEITKALPEEVKGIQIGSRLYDATGLESVIEADTNIGNGVITILPNSCCIIDEAQKVLLAERKNGCGKCTFCREGLGQLHAMTKEITEGKGKNEFLDLQKEIGEAMTFSCLCSVGQAGADFTRGALQYFAEEYTEHIKKKRCPTDVCTSFVNIYIDPARCKGCGECADVCPVDCIEGKSGFIHMIDEFDCTKCGKCMEACEHDAIMKATGRIPKLPTRLTKCGKFKKR